MKNIVFKPSYVLGDVVHYMDPPKPAAKYIPDWYRNMPTYMEGEKTAGLAFGNNYASNLTLKGCSPFLDALTFGYIYELPIDVEIKKVEDDKLSIRWRHQGEFISPHTDNQFPGLPKPVEYDSHTSVLKWAFPFDIVTPTGYSCIFTHPFNRHDLPFRTFTGVVDTDLYPTSVQFPFQWVASVTDRYILEKGTPLCQIVPIKRDAWKSVYDDTKDISISEKGLWQLRSKIVRSYKQQWWQKKVFK